MVPLVLGFMQAKAGIMSVMNIKKNASLADYTSFKVGGPAENLILPDIHDTLSDVLSEIDDVNLWVLGGGTNTLISDEGLPGTVIINSAGSVKLVDDTTITASSGTDWDELVSFVIKHNLYGLEFMSGIPGTVGGAVVGNIAAYGQKLADTLKEIDTYDTRTQETKTLKKDELGFDYRFSNLQEARNRHLVILDATFQLSKKPTSQLEYESALKVAAELKTVPHSLEDRRTIIMETRKRAGSLLSKAGTEHATAGSFFRNPLVNENQVEKILSYEEAGISKDKLLRQNTLHGGNSTRVSAAHVLLAAGFKRGQSWGKVRLHPDHILKIENTGGASAQDIYDVVELILATVQSKLDIKLEPEVRFLGHFN